MLRDEKEAVLNTISEFAKAGKSFSLVGIEKESLRFDPVKKYISMLDHPINFGSALSNNYITTDFAEAQLELITPAFLTIEEMLSFLDNIHHYVNNSLNNEILWSLSMPPNIDNDHDIKIAEYGDSHIANFKTSYRRGLSNRYGKLMQTISGVHFNFSLENLIFDSFDYDSKNLLRLKSELYLGIIRNLNRVSWLPIYLFGASPYVPKKLAVKTSEHFEVFDDDSYFLPQSTSLRQSEYGYSNAIQKHPRVSLNSLDEYISDLYFVTSTHNPDYEFISSRDGDELQQLNSNIFQIEDEFYAMTRAKSSSTKNIRPLSKLRSGGIDFIEYRVLDINPFTPIGIDKETCEFIKLLFIFALDKDSPPINDSEFSEILNNDLLVSKTGRNPDCILHHKGKEVSLKELGNMILDEMLISIDGLVTDFKSAEILIEEMRKKIEDPKLTISGILHDEIINGIDTTLDYGIKIADRHKNFYAQIPKKINEIWEDLEKESSNSINRQKELDNSKSESFSDYLDKYLVI